MAVRSFNYEEAKNTMKKVQDEAQKVKTYLNKCDSIINDNVGVKNRWSGERATNFKQKWEKASAEFNSFVQLINKYATKIDDSYRVHKQFDEASN